MSSRTLRAVLIAPAESLLQQMPRALVVSVLAMMVDVGVLFLLVALFAMPAIPAAILGYLAGGVIQYTLCSLWVFPGSPRNATVGFVAFTVLSLGGLGITAGVIQLLHDQWAWPLTIAKGIALGMAFNWNFFTRKFLLFRPAENEIQPTEVATPGA